MLIVNTNSPGKLFHACMNASERHAQHFELKKFLCENCIANLKMSNMGLFTFSKHKTSTLNHCVMEVKTCDMCKSKIFVIVILIIFYA